MRHSHDNIHSFVENDTSHDYNCFHTISIYFEERNRKMLPNEFIVYFRELCNCCYHSYCHILRNDLISYFCLDQNNYKLNVCPCLYKLTNKINVIDKTITKELIGQSFANRVINWKYVLHLDIFVANNSKWTVISCATCLKLTLKACSLVPPKGGNVCYEWTKFLSILRKTFLKKKSSIISIFAINVF